MGRSASLLADDFVDAAETRVRLVPIRRVMTKPFHAGDHVRWNSEAGRVSGVIFKKATSDTKFKGYTHHASKQEPQYLIKSDKTDHVAIHKGSALHSVPARQKTSNK